MKKIILTLLLITIVACSNNNSIDDNSDENSINITNFIYKTFNVHISPNTITTTIDYQLIDNKISSFSGTNTQTNQTFSGIYNYTNGKITELLKFNENVLTSKYNYTYNDQNLIELNIESINNSGQNSFSKHSFNHTLDTIFVKHQSSLDGINFNIDITDTKIIIDENGNRTYFERYDYLNNEITNEILEFDSNNNIIKEEKINFFDGSEITTLTNTISYDNSINSLYKINTKMYGRKNLMLTYHIFKNDVINSINAKILSPNNIVNFNTTFGNSLFTFQFENIINDNEYSQKNIFEVKAIDEIFGKFSFEYFFD